MLISKKKILPLFVVLALILIVAGCATATAPTPTPIIVLVEPTAVVLPTAAISTATLPPPTDTPEPTLVPPTVPPTDVPTEAPTDPPPPPTDAPTDVPPTFTPTPELAGFFVPAERAASMYKEADLEAVPFPEVVQPGEQVKVVGISANWYWLLAEYHTGTVGWVANDRFNLEGVSLFNLPVTSYRDGDSREVISGGADSSSESQPPPPPPSGEALFDVAALRDAALFAEPSVETGRTGYYVPAGTQAGVVGRSADRFWVHVIARGSGREGWVATNYLDLEAEAINELGVSEFVTVADSSIAEPTAAPTATPWPTPEATAPTVWPTKTNTPVWPTKTATPIWPTATSVPAGQQPTAAPDVPTVTLPPDATTAPEIEATEVPAPTLAPDEPTLVPTEALPPTETPIPTETPTPAPTPIPTTDAVATWSAVAESTVAGFGGWDSAILIAVPSGSTYVFEIEYGRSTSLFDRGGGVDTYFVTLSGMPCGTNVSAELLALQNGFKMQIKDENGNPGNVMIASPC